jgi:hypothetical protein
MQEMWVGSISQEQWEDWSKTFTFLSTSTRANSEECVEMCDGFRRESMAPFVGKLANATTSLEVLCTGTLSGEDWRKSIDVATESTYDTVLAALQATIFSSASRGWNKRVKDAKNEVAAAMMAIDVEAKTLGVDTASTVYQSGLDAGYGARYLSEVSLGEAKIVHNITRDAKTNMAVRKQHVEDEMMRLNDLVWKGKSAKPVRTVHAIIKAKALEFVRA